MSTAEDQRRAKEELVKQQMQTERLMLELETMKLHLGATERQLQQERTPKSPTSAPLTAENEQLAAAVANSLTEKLAQLEVRTSMMRTSVNARLVDNQQHQQHQQQVLLNLQPSTGNNNTTGSGADDAPAMDE